MAEGIIFKLQRPLAIDEIPGGQDLDAVLDTDAKILCYNEDRSIAFEHEATPEVLEFFKADDRKVKTFAYGKIVTVPGQRGAMVQWIALAPWQEW